MNIQLLDAILSEDVEPRQFKIPELMVQLRHARRTVANLEFELKNIKHDLCFQLALLVRKAQPGLNVSVDKNSCKIGYKSKLFEFEPDIENGIWRLSSQNNRYAREFVQHHRDDLLIDSEISQLAQAIVNHFIAYFRTLNDEISGTGTILVEGRLSTLCGLVRHERIVD